MVTLVVFPIKYTARRSLTKNDVVTFQQRHRTWSAQSNHPQISQIHLCNLWMAFVSERFLGNMSAQRSPASLMRWAIVRNVKLFGWTSPRSISFHVHGAETGAPGLARTV